MPLLAQNGAPGAETPPHQPVLLISVDGMRPDYVTRADEHRLQLPTLRRILASGTHATGVNAVLPTITYPSHTTLITGVTPARRGILTGTGITKGRDLGIVDMRQIAPTLANLLGVSLPTATQPALDVH